MAYAVGLGRVRSLGRVQTAQPAAQQSRTWIDEWLLDRLTAAALREAGLDEASVWQAVTAIKVLTTHQQWHTVTTSPSLRGTKQSFPIGPEIPRTARNDTLERAFRLAEVLFADADVQQLLRVNEYQGVVYFNQEAFNNLLWWLLAVAVIDVTANPEAVADDVPAVIVAAYEVIEALQDAEARSDYQVEKLKAALIARP